MEAAFFRRPTAIPLRATLWMHALGAGAYVWLQPRGFEFGSRPFFERQVIVPAVFAVSFVAAALPARWPAAGMISTGFLAGFWALVSAVVGSVGTTSAARGMWILLAASLGSAALFVRWTLLAGGRAGLPLGGAAAGALVALAFLFCAWAPPASTRPFPGPVPAEPKGEGRGGFRITVSGRSIVVERGGDQVVVDPGIEFDAFSRSGFWTLFDFQPLRLPPWKVERRTDGVLVLSSQTEEMESDVRVWTESGDLRVRAVSRLRREVSAHLAAAMTLYTPLDARVGGVPWPKGSFQDPLSFVAFREETLQFLRASRDEKGPFEVLATLEPGDPPIEAGPWRIRVRGWAEQASREPSPTAGWGVSQGAIERWDGALTWSLASTSIGRGWHAVRTAPGTYVLEAAIGFAPER